MKIVQELKFDHTNKWYMHNPKFVLENERHKILWNFEIQTDHLISARRPDLVIDYKKKKRENLPNSGLCCPSWPESEIKRKQKERQVLRPCQRTKKIWKVTVIPTVIGALVTISKELVNGLEDLEIRRQVETIQTAAILRSDRKLRRVLETWWDIVSQIPGKVHQLTLVLKTLK